MTRLWWSIFVVVLLSMPALSSVRDELPPKISVALSKATVKRGETVKSVLKIRFAEGFYGYQNPPTEEYQIPVTLATKPPGVKIKVAYPKGVLREGVGATAALYEGDVDIPFEVAVDRPRGRVLATFDVRYQQCTETNCFPPRTKSVQTALTVR